MSRMSSFMAYGVLNKCFNGLAVVNVELTSRCNKDCWMCGRRKVDREYPEIVMNYGDMDFKVAGTRNGITAIQIVKAP